MSRFEPVSEEVVGVCEKVRNDKFPWLDGANIQYIFDTKKRVSKGAIVIARIKKLNDEMKFLSMEYDGRTYDYCMFIDKAIWMNISERDRDRIVYHEFCHCEVNSEKDEPFGVRDHEIKGFYDEIIYNVDDPRWSERMDVIAEATHDPENKEMPEGV